MQLLNRFLWALFEVQLTKLNGIWLHVFDELEGCCVVLLQTEVSTLLFYWFFYENIKSMEGYQTSTTA
jgi:hypothetical protein